MVALKSELWINRVLTLLMIGSVLWIGITGFKRDDSQIDQEEMDSKATIDYVDSKDIEIKTDFKEYKEVHQIQHDGTQSLLESMDKKIDILLTAK